MNDTDKQAGQPCETMCGRQNGKAVLSDTIRRLRRRADELQILHDMLPERPTPEQDQALWSIACNIERR